MPLNSRAKGATGERALCDEFERLGMLAERTVQYCGRSGDAADVRLFGTDLHIECKRTERITMREWVEQATRDAHARDWVIATKQNHRPWMIILSLEQWARSSSHAASAMAERSRRFNEASGA